MSFMFNPYPYDDLNAVNRITVDKTVRNGITCGPAAAAKRIVLDASGQVKAKGRILMALDGYVSAPLKETAGVIAVQCAASGLPCHVIEADLFKQEKILESELEEYLPLDPEKDPVLLYGKVYKKGFEGLCDGEKIKTIRKAAENFLRNGEGLLVIYGNGVLINELRPLFDINAYIDMTPKRTILNLKAGKCRNLGSGTYTKNNLTLRRAYYVDFEAAGALRLELLREAATGETAKKPVNYYIAGDSFEDMRVISIEHLHALFSRMLSYPLRCRPVYIEGVWGGFYIKRLRHLPDQMKNCAWVFDLIPLEVSIVADMEGLQMEFPFFTFVQATGEKLLGEKSVARFGRYFPIRFNYDDTFHSSGNMSIQVHPDEKYVVENNGEFGRQDESYYIIATAQDAKTYAGFREGADVEEFIAKARLAEKTGQGFDHDKYVYSRPSVPGAQFMLPAGTIHASGRNQLILEIGSLTIGSYTYKMYDYLRKDLDGNPRPIHTYHGDKVLKREHKENWVSENLIQTRRVIRQGEGWTEYIVGEHDLLYFSLRNIVFTEKYEDETVDRFHVLILVDGEKVLVRSKNDHTRCFRQNFLEMVIVPANFGPYEVINEGVGIVTVHKTMLKEGFEKE